MQLRLKTAIAVAASVGTGLCAGSLALPAESLADTVPAWARYHVSFDGTAVYHIEGTTGTRTEKIEATLGYGGSVDDVTFNGHAFDPSPAGKTTLTKAEFFGTADDSDPKADPNHGACAGDSGATAGPGVAVLPDRAPGDGSIAARVNPFQLVGITIDCYGLAERWGPSAAFGNAPVNGSGYEPFTVEIHLPPEAMRMGKVIQLYDQQVQPGYCPGDSNGSGVKACTLELKGTVTFLRTAASTKLVPYPAAPAPPGPSVHPGPVTSPSNLGPPDDSDLLVPLTAKAASVAADASSATVNVGCTGRCAYVVSVFAATGGARTAAARPLASAHGVLRSAGTKRLRLRFSARARRAIRRSGGLRVVVSASAPGGHTTRSRVLTLRLRHR